MILISPEMDDSKRESLSYFRLYKKILQVKKIHKPQCVSFGRDKNQYFLYYEPEKPVSDKVIKIPIRGIRRECFWRQEKRTKG